MTDRSEAELVMQRVKDATRLEAKRREQIYQAALPQIAAEQREKPTPVLAFVLKPAA